MDSNGRIKLSPRVLEDFMRTGPDLVLRCLPEGSIGVYPESVFLAMRGSSENTVQQAANSILYRRTLRSFNAMSQPEKISAQGRITLPGAFRDFAGLILGKEVVVVGVDIGVEIWSRERWEEEQKKIMHHMDERGDLEMAADLNALRPD